MYFVCSMSRIQQCPIIYYVYIPITVLTYESITIVLLCQQKARYYNNIGSGPFLLV